jgi:peptidyl-prolyl cis-trans isomerase-like 2
MGGKNRHSQDRMFITAKEWKNEYGGKKSAKSNEACPIDFNVCALALSPFGKNLIAFVIFISSSSLPLFVLETPCCAQEGVIFDLVNLVPFIRKYKANPVTGEEMSTKDIIRLNMVLSIYNHMK